MKEGGENLNWARRFLIQDVIKAGFDTFEALAKQKPQNSVTYFGFEEKAVKELNPYLLRFVTKVCIENRSAILQKSKTILPTLFSMCLAVVVKFWNNGERLMLQHMLHSCMQIIFFLNEYIGHFGTSGVFEAIVNNPLLTKIASTINYENKEE